MIRWLIVLCLIVGVCYGDSEGEEKQPPQAIEKILIDHILNGYDRDARPVTEQTDGLLTVNVSMHLMQIVEMDIKGQVLVTYLWMTMEWKDHLLKWEPKDFSNLENIRLPIERIWAPDLELYNSANDDISLSDGHTPAIIKYNGTVSWIEPKELRSKCVAEITYFPFDQQTCDLKIGSWTHDGLKMDLEADTEKLGFEDFASVGEWTLLHTEVRKSSNYYSCCPEPYVDITATLVLQRKPMHWFCNTILPSLLMSIILVLTLQLSPDSILRLGVEIIIVILFTILMGFMTAVLPNSPSSTSILFVYLVVMVILSFLSVVITIMILKLYKAGSEISTSFLLRKLKNQMLSGRYNVHQTMQNGLSAAPSVNCIDMSFHRDDMPLTEYSFTESVNHRDPNSGLSPAGNQNQAKVNNCVGSSTGVNVGSSTSAPQNRNMISSPSQQAGTKTQDYSNIVCRCHYGQIIGKDAAEWKFVAQKLDRIFFYVFALVALFVNLSLIVLPISRI